MEVIVSQISQAGVKEEFRAINREALAEVNPSLIYCSVSGYGQDGDLHQRAGHDINYLALTGLASYSGRRKGGPTLSGCQVADIAGGSHQAVIGILSAAIHRMKTGEGQKVDISIADGALALNGMDGAAYTICKQEAALESGGLNGGSFYDFYECSDGRYFSVGSLEPKFALSLFESIGRMDLAPLAAKQDVESQVNLKKEMRSTFKSKSFQDWQDIFSKKDACVEPVLNLSEVAEIPHFQQRGMFVQVPKGDGTTQTQIANPIKFSKCEAQYRFTGQSMGKHNLEVMESAGFSAAEIEELAASGLFGAPPSKELRKNQKTVLKQSDNQL